MNRTDNATHDEAIGLSHAGGNESGYSVQRQALEKVYPTLVGMSRSVEAYVE